MSQTTQFPPTATNVPAWTEDANSPFSSGPAFTHSFDMGDSHTDAMVLVNIGPANSNGVDLFLDIGTGDYGYQEVGGATTTSASSWKLGTLGGQSFELVGWLWFQPFDGGMSVTAALMCGNGFAANSPLASGAVAGVESVSEFNITSGATGETTVEIEVFHR